MGLPLNQMVPNCTPNNLRLPPNYYRNSINDSCNKFYRHDHRHFSSRNGSVLHDKGAGRTAYAIRSRDDGQRRDDCNRQLLNRFKENLVRSQLKANKAMALSRRLVGSADLTMDTTMKRYRKAAPLPLPPPPVAVTTTRKPALTNRLHVVEKTSIINNINRIQYLRNSYPIISNMPLINIQNSSIMFINDSPLALHDKRFGILHHSSPSETYFN